MTQSVTVVATPVTPSPPEPVADQIAEARLSSIRQLVIVTVVALSPMMDRPPPPPNV